MVNTRTDAELAAAVQAAVDAMLPQIREQVREEYRTGAVASGSNPPPVTIHTWLERFNKQKPRSFEKAVAPVDAENWISHMEKIFDVMDCNDAFKTRLAVYKFEGDALAWWKAYKQAKGGDAWVLTLTWAAFKELFFLQFFPRAEQERLKREYHSIRQRASENSTEYMQRFLRLAGFLGQAAGTAEEQAKNFRWGLHKSILDHVMCIQFTDVAQVADAARNLEILRDRDDYDRSERSDKRHKSGDRYQSATQQNSYRSHDQKNDRQGSDRQDGGGILVLDATKGTEVSNLTDLPTRVPSSPGYPLRVILTLCATHMDVDTQESVVVLLVLALNVVRLVIFSGTARRTLVLVRLVMHPSWIFKQCSAMLRETPVISAGFQEKTSKFCPTSGGRMLGPEIIAHSIGMILLLRNVTVPPSTGNFSIPCVMDVHLCGSGMPSSHILLDKISADAPPSTYIRCTKCPPISASMIIGPSVPSLSPRGGKDIVVSGEKLWVGPYAVFALLNIRGSSGRCALHDDASCRLLNTPPSFRGQSLGEGDRFWLSLLKTLKTGDGLRECLRPCLLLGSVRAVGVFDRVNVTFIYDLSVGLCIRAREVTISCTARQKPLALPWGRTPRLDSGVKKERLWIAKVLGERLEFIKMAWNNRSGAEMNSRSSVSIWNAFHQQILIVSVGVAITFGGVALAWSYLPTGKGSSPPTSERKHSIR
ncbi:zinc finger, CCHC-type, retrotransposon gag domain protein [Tanacetum coccineum]|uniref:Zinc finger, CCHC-type, retrotransposon gag domain protein n=1 Tax=Tanacetum coccineum TaxID=301880 RepID=A0ABQ5DZB9_9ASTR